MEREAAAFGDNGASKAGVIAVDEGDCVAVLVDGGEVYCVGMIVCWTAVVCDL